jgi:hypothetical protein
MNAYLFASVVTCSALRPSNRFSGPAATIQTWDSCSHQIVFGSSLDDAHERFEKWLTTLPSDENRATIIVRKIAGAKFLDRLLTESGNLPLDWPQVAQQVAIQLGSTPVDDFEQGYWVNVNEVVRPERLSLNIDALQRDLPDEIRSGLNWSIDKKFFFVLTVLSPGNGQPAANDPTSEETCEDKDVGEPNGVSATELYDMFPQALDKDAAVVIRARNSVVAAWLWRRHAAGGPLATRSIRIDPWCEAINLK